MGHERRQTLDMILELASTVYQPPSSTQYSTGVQSDSLCDNQSGVISSGYCTPSTDGGSSHGGHGTWSSASSGTGSSGGWGQGTGAASHPGRSSGCGSSVSSGQYSPMSTSSSCSPSLSPKPEQEQPSVMPHKFSVPPPSHQHSTPVQYQAP